MRRSIKILFLGLLFILALSDMSWATWQADMTRSTALPSVDRHLAKVGGQDSTPPLKKELTPECLSCIKETLQILKDFGDRIWKGFGQLNVRVNIITPGYEFFFGDADAPAGYGLYQEEPVLGKPVFFKKREYRREFAATIETIEGKPALFISSKEVFEKTYARSPLYKIAEDYIFTVLQGYFHLYVANRQISFNTKFSSPPANAPLTKEKYPYLDFINTRLLDIEGEELLEAMNAKDQENQNEHLSNFLRVRQIRLHQLNETYGLDFFPYENWSEWSEGLAKYTEIEFARYVGSGSYKPCRGVHNVGNFKNYSFVKNKLKFELSRLKSTRNSIVHAARGMTEALILERLEVPWKEKIFESDRFLIDFLQERSKFIEKSTSPSQKGFKEASPGGRNSKSIK
jgi:hypothetical protein